MKNFLSSSLLIGSLFIFSGCSFLGMNVDPSQNIDDVQPPLTNTLPGPANEYTFLFDGTNVGSVTTDHVAGEPTKIFFINDGKEKMTVNISFPEGEGNLRLSQIIMPDGEMDGPFGQNTTYELTQSGGYQLIFNENMMAGDPWSGKATITVTLE